MSLDMAHQDRLVEWLSAPASTMHQGAVDFNCAMQILAGVVEDFGAPHVRMRPAVYPDGDKWCALYGKDLQEGVAGFGDTPAEACKAFDNAWDGK